MPSSVSPSCTMVNATSGWMPTMTVSAPRNLSMWAMARSVRVAKESMTSSTVTSIITPRERYCPTCAARSSRKPMRSSSESTDWMLAIRQSRCLRIGTRMLLLDEADLVAQESFGFFESALEVAHGVHFAQIHANGDQGLGNLGGKTGDNDAGAHEPGGLDGLDQVIGHRR